MRKVLVLLLVAACGDGPADSDDTLIAMLEGTPVRHALAAPGQTAWPDAPWASVDGDELVLMPGCGVVTGTSGPPKLFVLDRAEGDRSITVQVSPSAEGDCRPRVLTCIEADDGTCDYEVAPTQNDHLETHFCTMPNCNSSDEIIHFKLDKRGDDDDPLFGRVTGDAPLHFLFTAGSPGPLNFPAGADVRAALYDTNITGDFRISYEIARNMNSDMKIASGTYALRWNSALRFGIDPEFCLSAATGCEIKHAPSRIDNTVCIRAGDPQVTVALSVWLGVKAAQQGDHVYLTTPNGSATFHSSTTTSNAGILLPVDATAQTVFADVSSAGTFTFQLIHCVEMPSPGSPPSCTAVKANPQTFPIDAITKVRIQSAPC